MKYRSKLGDEYSPLYYLAALGSGGLLVTFFMYLMFMVPHKGQPIPTFDSLAAQLAKGDPLTTTAIIVGAAGVIIFALFHFRLLFWNIREYRHFKTTERYAQLRQSDAEVQLMAMPLTYAMTMNVLFILGALFVPGLWNVVEYLFPFALLAFLGIGIYAVKIFLGFISRVIAFGQFDCEKNNSLSQMLSIFAFSMVAVGFSASGAMSHNQLTSGLGIILAAAFLSFTMVLGTIKIVLGFRSMFENGVNKESAISLWIVIPILTLMGIAAYRMHMGLAHNFGFYNHTWIQVLLFTAIVAMQSFFGLLGYRVMKHTGYFREFVSGNSKSVATYAAICPGVAFVVMGNFLINKGLASAGIAPKFSLTYFLLYAPLVYLQIKTIIVLFRLNRKMLGKEG